MKDLKAIKDFLTEKANSNENNDIINKIQSEDFLNHLKAIMPILKELNLEIYDNAEKDIITKISRSLTRHYFTIYYVNIENNSYYGYSSSDGYKSLNIDEHGSDFFKDTIINAKKFVYKNDINRVLELLQKENLLRKIRKNNTSTICYRLLINGKQTPVALTALKLTDDDSNMIIGVSLASDQQKIELEYQDTINKHLTYSNIALALAKNFFTIYYVNLVTDDYIEYSVDSEVEELREVDRGHKFFNTAFKLAQIHIYEQDRPKFIEAIKKENILKELQKKKLSKIIYRQIFNNEPIYVSLNATLIDEENMIFAVSNIDDERKKHDEYLKRLENEKLIARTDSLTGLLNRYSYNEVEQELIESIKKHEVNQFSIVVCDINDLKLINDTLGHEAGDNYIISAKTILKSIFKSPIYRVGGDEFVIILQHEEYLNREYIIEQLAGKNIENALNNEVMISVGMADYKPGDSYSDVFNRADNSMYENKKFLKLTKKKLSKH